MEICQDRKKYVYGLVIVTEKRGTTEIFARIDY